MVIRNEPISLAFLGHYSGTHIHGEKNATIGNNAAKSHVYVTLRCPVVLRRTVRNLGT